MRACCTIAPRCAPVVSALLLAASVAATAAAAPVATQAATQAATPAALREQAFASLWAENAATAITLFREYLATPGGDADREARRGLALACSWDGRQGEALALYRDLLAADPADGASRVGVGRTLLWDNRLREGWRALGDAAAGDTATAAAANDVMLLALDEYTPPLSVSATTTWDSDDLRVTRLALASTTTTGHSLFQVSPGYAWLRQPGQPDAEALRLGAGLVTGLGRRGALHAFGWLDRYTTDDALPATGAALDWYQLGGDAWLTWLPAARWRVDLGAGSQPVETFVALGRNVARHQGSLSVERRLTRHWTAGVVGIAGAYSDGNRSDRVTARLAWVRDGRWRVQAGPVANYLDFRVPYPGGYWAPADMRSAGLEASLRTRGRSATLRLSGSVAREKEADARALTVGGASARVGWRFARDWLLSVEGGRSQSALGSASGYHRTTLGIDVRAFF